MRISNTTGCFPSQRPEERVRMLAEAGFDCADFSMSSMINDGDILNSDEYLSVVETVRRAGLEYGISFNQGHALFNVRGSSEEEIISVTKARTIRSLEISSLLGIKTLIVHPLQLRPYFGNEGFLAEFNRAYYLELIRYAEKYGVVIACENMWQSEPHSGKIHDSICADPYEFNRYIDDIGSPFLTACLDLGHCGLCGREAQGCLRLMGKRVTALHVHDNDYISDQHTLPFLGRMDWDEITKALAEIDYDGDLTFETDGFFAPFDSACDIENGIAALKLNAGIGRRLVKMIEEHKRDGLR